MMNNFQAVTCLTALTTYLTAVARFKNFSVQSEAPEIRVIYQEKLDAVEKAFEEEYQSRWETLYGPKETTE